jgi:hypothetical protein
MEEYNLFFKLSTLNNLINNDLLLIEKCASELSLKQERETKMTIQKRLQILVEENHVSSKKAEEKISKFEKDLIDKERELKEKEDYLIKARSNVKEVISDNRNLEISLSNLKCKPK